MTRINFNFSVNILYGNISYEKVNHVYGQKFANESNCLGALSKGWRKGEAQNDTDKIS